MVLPSQMGRQAAPRHRTTSRRRRGRRTWPWLAVLAAVAAVLFLLFSPSNSPEPAAAVNEREMQPTQGQAAGVNDDNSRGNGPAGIPNVDEMPEQESGVPVAESIEVSEPEPIAEGDSVPIESAVSITHETAVQDSSSETGADAEPFMDDPTVESVTPVEPAVPPRAETEPPAIELKTSQVHALIDRGQSVEARHLLSAMLGHDEQQLDSAAATFVRRELNTLNERLFFSKAVVAGDPLVEYYRVLPGDNFTKIGRKYWVPYRLLMRINGIKKDTSLRAGQEIKAVRGPLHAIITKREFSMDVYATGPKGDRIYVKSFAVGLGEDDSTPTGQWVVGRGKTVNPDWQNPRTREYFGRDHAENPIGEYWIPLRGADATTAQLRRYGIHGTIDPDSIGRQASMGCVRLLPTGIELVYQLLVEERSRVTIR